MDDNKLIVSSSPHIRGPEDIRRIMWAVVAALAPAVVWGIYVFRNAQPEAKHWFASMPFYPAFLVALAVATAVLTEAVIQKCRGKRITISDGSAVVTGLLLAMVISPCAPWYVPIIGSFVAIAIAKHCFGGLGCNIWNPALVGRAFVLSSFVFSLTAVWHYPLETHEDVTRWGEQVRPVPADVSEVDAVSQATPLAARKDALKAYRDAPADPEVTPKKLLAKLNADNNTGYVDLLVGTVGGCLGETSALLLLLGGGFLMLRGYVKWQVPVPYLGTVALLGWALPVKLQGQLVWFAGDPLFHLLAGGLFLGAFFMATDMVTSPITKKGMILFGVGCGVLTAVIRVFGGYPEGVAYSILLMNTAVPLIDRHIRPTKYGAVK